MVANVYIEHLEETVLQTAAAHLTHRLWLRYMDDTFVVWQHGQDELECFHEHLNTQYNNIKFTVVLENENKMEFLMPR